MSGFVQGNYASPQTNQSSVPVSFTANQTSGNLNVVVVGWTSVSSTINSVTDSNLNVYQVANPLTRGPAQSQAIYYSAAIRSGTNTVTVVFSAAVPFADIQISEYNGVNAIDITATGSGTSITPTSSSFTTTKGGDIIVAAVNTGGTVTSAGTNFTQRILTSPDFDLTEDWTPGTTVTATATANLAASDTWVINVVAFYSSAFIPPAYIQSAYSTPQTAQSSVPVAFVSSQTTGNLNVAVIGWEDATSTISTVTDSNANSYQVAVPITRGPAQSQAIYYARGIAAGANTVTVAFSAAVPFPDIRIAEYSGANIIDRSSTGTGTGTTASVTSFTTAQAADVLVGAATTSGTVSGPAPGFNQRIITSPDGDILQDQIPGATITTSMPTPLTGTDTWVAQVVAFFQGPLILSAIPTAESFGNLSVLPTGTATVTLSGIATAEIFGSPTVNAPATLVLSGIGSSETFGLPLLNAQATVNLSGISSPGTFGNVNVTRPVTGFTTAARCL